MTTAAIQFNALVRLLETYGDELAALIGSQFALILPQRADTARDACEGLRAIQRAFDSAPLYALSEPAETRAHDLWSLEGRVLDTLPTAPVAGCIVAARDTASFVLSRGSDHVILTGTSIPVEGQGRCDRLAFGLVHVCGHNAVTRASAELVARETRSMCDVILAGTDIDCRGEVLSTIGCTQSASVYERRPNGQYVKASASTAVNAAVVSSALKHAIHDVARAFAALHFIDRPTHYVVEECPDRVPVPRAPAKKIARYDDRERWIILDPEEVKTKMVGRTDHKGGTHASPHLHLRRGHTKTLRDERYTFKRGQVINIRPTWVGDREWAQGHLKYKVVSRIGAEAHQA